MSFQFNYAAKHLKLLWKEKLCRTPIDCEMFRRKWMEMNSPAGSSGETGKSMIEVNASSRWFSAHVHRLDRLWRYLELERQMQSH